MPKTSVPFTQMLSTSDAAAGEMLSGKFWVTALVPKGAVVGEAPSRDQVYERRGEFPVVRSLMATVIAMAVLIGAGEGGVTVVIGPWVSATQAPSRLDDVSQGFVVTLPESFAATGPVAAPNQLQVALVRGAPTLRRSDAVFDVMLLRLISALDGLASPRSKPGVPCASAAFPD